MPLTESHPIYKVSVDAHQGQASAENAKDGASTHILALTSTQVNAIRKLLDEIKSGTDVSSVVTAINLL